MNIYFTSHCIVIYLIGMGILDIVDNANRIFVSYCIYMLSREDFNNLGNDFSPILIWIYSWELLLYSFIEFECEYQYLWNMKAWIFYHIVLICNQVKVLTTGWMLLHLSRYDYVVDWFWMSILVSVANAKIIVVSNYFNILSRYDTKNLVNVTPAMQVQIYPSEVIPQSFF